MRKGYLDGLKGLINSKAPEDWDFSERRQVIRLECYYEVEATLPGGRPFEGAIVDLGLHGMKLQTPQPLKAGDSLSLRFLDKSLMVCRGGLDYSVLWTRARPRDRQVYAGLVYSGHPSTLAASWPGCLLDELGFRGERTYQKRKHIRTDCAVAAELIFEEGSVLEGRLRNLGVGGALIESAWPLAENSTFELRLGTFAGLARFLLPARLVRSRAEGGRFLHGVEFESLDAVQMRALSLHLFHLLGHQWADQP